MKTFGIVHNIPSPYRLHVFRALSAELKSRGWEVHVHFMSDMSRGYEERPLSWRNPKMDFPYTYWRDYGCGQRHFNPGLLWWLARHPVDVLWCGSPFDTGTGMLAARCARAKVTCSWCEGNTRNPGALGGVKGRIKRWVLSSYDYVAVPGLDGARYIDLHRRLTNRNLARPVTLPNLVDETRFRPRDSYDAWEIQRIRTACGTGPDEKLAILPCRFVWEKGLKEFFSLVRPEQLKGWHLVVIGDGVERSSCYEIIRSRGLERFVTNVLSVRYDEMPAYYAASDLLLLPSQQDQNPLSVVEALHAGLPIAISSEAGNIDEALDEGRNGWRIPVKDATGYARALTEVFSSDLAELRRMGEYSRTHNAQFWNTAKCIRQFVDVLTKGL